MYRSKKCNSESKNKLLYWFSTAVLQAENYQKNNFSTNGASKTGYLLDWPKSSFRFLCKIHIGKTELLCCTHETNTMELINYASIKKVNR